MIHRMAASGLYSWPFTEESTPVPESEDRKSFNGKLDTSESWSDVSDCGVVASDGNTVYDGGANSLPDRLIRSVELGCPVYYNDADFFSQHENRRDPTQRTEPDDSSKHQMSNGVFNLSNITGRNQSKTKKDQKPSPQKHHKPSNSRDSATVSGSADQGEKIKTKFLVAWNNMKYGLSAKMKTNFRYDSPIWILGKCYHRSFEGSEEQDKEQEAMAAKESKHHFTSMEEFKRDFTSRFWFTYRREFSPLPGAPSITSDCGWGCMLRTGQMMLAQALIMYFLGRDWRWHRKQTQQEVFYHREIVKFFGDFPSEQCPFSIHHLVQIGASLGKKPGDWYGPASVAHIIREAVTKVHTQQPILRKLSVYVAQDCTVYNQDLMDLCTHKPRSSARNSSTSECSLDGSFEEMWGPVVILIPVRLGGEVLNPIYTPCVKSLLTLDQCLGIMGGKPKHSVLFIGWQDDKLIYLDPHFVQEAVDIRQRDFPVHSYHCMSPRKMLFTKMDPSCTIAFYCRNFADYDDLVTHAKEIVAPPMQKGEYPMFIFADGRCNDMNPFSHTGAPDRGGTPDMGATLEQSPRAQKISEKTSRRRQSSNESEDFVMLG